MVIDLEIISKAATEISIIGRSRNDRVRLDPSSLEKKTLKRRVRSAIAENKEVRWYYFPDTNFEVIKTAIPPNYEQPFHRHVRYMEAMVVLKGEVIVVEEKLGKIIEKSLGRDDFAMFSQNKNFFHTVKNSSQKYAYILTFKFKGSKNKNKESFINDWYGK